MSIYDFYAGCLSSCQEWASEGARTEMQVLLAQLPEVNRQVPLDVASLSIAFASNTDLTNGTKILSFRQNFNTFLQGIQSSAFSSDAEPWYSKDMVQTLAEIFLMRDLQPITREIKALIVELVVDFGLDGMASVAFFLALRLKYGVGRGEEMSAKEEGIWLAGASWEGIQRAVEYIYSDRVGELSLCELLVGLV
eukprot:comp70807_c0_seq1/m.48114 comp70807_c0_seq1/g.48114  ORF comp70807_c0_seq1/g.48114 comp70807_c0_seq1/m.48114 type:complete len:194 (-) comp70807_c0_seq1:92-673(-)